MPAAGVVLHADADAHWLLPAYAADRAMGHNVGRAGSARTGLNPKIAAVQVLLRMLSRQHRCENVLATNPGPVQPDLGQVYRTVIHICSVKSKGELRYGRTILLLSVMPKTLLLIGD